MISSPLLSILGLPDSGSAPPPTVLQFLRTKPPGVTKFPAEYVMLGTPTNMVMDDGELDLSSQILLPGPELSNYLEEEYMKNTRTSSCMHTHTCNPPGPAATSHTHTCHHTHTQVFASTSETETHMADEPKKTRCRPLGNREAVRKYREKKKAHTAFLEEEVQKLGLINQQLLKRLQGQAALEAEAFRLRSLLSDMKTKIDSEIGNFPFQKELCEIGDVKCNDMTS